MGLKYMAERHPATEFRGQNKINFDYVRHCQNNMPCIFFTLYQQVYRYGDSNKLLKWEVKYRYLINFNEIL